MDVRRTVLAKLRGGKEPTEKEKEMAVEAMDRLAQVLCRIPTKMVLQGKKAYATFVESSRLLGLLPTLSDRNTGAPRGEKDVEFLKKAMEAAQKTPAETKPTEQTKHGIETTVKRPREAQPHADASPTLGRQAQPDTTRAPEVAEPVRQEPVIEEPSTKKPKRGREDTPEPSQVEPAPQAEDEAEEDSSEGEETSDDTSEYEDEEEEEDSPPKVPKREADESRVTLKQEMKRPPRRFTGMEFHKLKSLSGVKFFAEADVVDPDDKTHVFTFNINTPWHCASLNLGEGADGSPLISYSDIHCFYRLPDGTQWVQHGHFWDTDDIKEHAKKHGLKYNHLFSNNHGEKELLKKDGIHYSRITDIEYECWVFDGREKVPEPEHLEGDSYFWRHTFDVDQWKLTS